MRVAILNISIGRYTVFWKEFYETCELNFMPNDEKEYFVFTDDMNIIYGKEKNVHLIFQDDMGWPYNTMKRFHLFKSIESELLKFDYIFFMNGNMVFLKKLERTFINPNKNIITLEHPRICKI